MTTPPGEPRNGGSPAKAQPSGTLSARRHGGGQPTRPIGGSRHGRAGPGCAVCIDHQGRSPREGRRSAPHGADHAGTVPTVVGPRRAECETEPLPPGMTDEARSGAAAGRTCGRRGAEAPRRCQRASRPPSDSHTAVWADSARVGWRRVFRAGDDRRPASRWRLGAAAVRGRRVVRIVVTVGYPESGENAEPARRGMDRTWERRRCAPVPGWVPSGTADPPPPAKGLHAEVASARTLRASGLTRRPLHPRNRCRRAADRRRPRRRPSATRFRPVLVRGVASGHRPLLVHCLPWQRRDRLPTNLPL
jgi:hypothetical protein